MHDLYSILEELCETLTKEAEMLNDKIRSVQGKVSAADMEYIDRLTHSVKSVKTTMAMLDAEENGYSNARYYNDGGMDGSYARRRYSRDGGSYGDSYARGRGRNARRDSMGRYSSDGYSRAKEDMVKELEDLMEDAPDEGTRVKFQSFIEEIRKR